MKTAVVFILMSVALRATPPTERAALLFVEGGPFKNQRSNYYAKGISDSFVARTVAVASFLIGRCEVTQKEWIEVMGSNPSKFRGDDLPVETVSWYDCIEYCNRRSAKEGLQPCYTIDREHKDPNNHNEIDPLKWTVTLNAGANGYRLPTEMEWEYAASGGRASRSFVYSGSDQADQVGWYFANSGDQALTGYWSWAAAERNHNQTHPVGSKAPNELGLYDLSGNVREWCWNYFADTANNGPEPAGGAAGRVWRGGGWMGGDFCCASNFRASFEASGKGPDQGFRICRNP